MSDPLPQAGDPSSPAPGSPTPTTPTPPVTPTTPPIARAGESRLASAAAPVVLIGADSVDPKGGAITYAWTQTAGPAVALNNPTAQNPSFTPPSSAGNPSLTFSLVVTDSQGRASAPSTVIVTLATDTNHQLSGHDSTCVVLTSGAVRCWGLNTLGAVGDGSTTSRSTPVTVAGVTGTRSIECGTGRCCALSTTGSLKCWGKNDTGELGDGTTTARLSPVNATAAGTDLIQVSLGDRHSCGLNRGGGVRCWGRNVFGQLGNGTTVDSTAAVGVVGLSSGVVAIAAGSNQTCALTQNGGVKCWGGNANGQLGDGTNIDRATPTDVPSLALDVVGIATPGAGTSSYAILRNGKLKSWGYNLDFGRLGDGTTLNRSTPVDPVGMSSGVARISSANGHICTLMNNGAARCWGLNGSRQLADGTLDTRLAPVGSNGATSGATDIAAGIAHSCAKFPSTGNLVRCWGSNVAGELGNGTTAEQTGVVQVIGL